MENSKKDHSESQEAILNEMLKQNDIAFESANSLKKSITTEEFNAVLFWLENEHKKCVETIQSRHKAARTAKNNLIKLKEFSQISEEEFSNMVKSAKALLNAGDREMMKLIGEKIKTVNYIASFLNIFKNEDEKLEKVNINFIKNIKNGNI